MKLFIEHLLCAKHIYFCYPFPKVSSFGYATISGFCFVLVFAFQQSLAQNHFFSL